MSVANNHKHFREAKSLLQKEVYTEIGLKPARYNKLKKGLVEPSIDILEKLSAFYDVTIDEIIHYNTATPKEIKIEDKTAVEQVRLLGQLNEKDKDKDKDKGTVINITDTILTKQKFQNFFEQNLEPAK